MINVGCQFVGNNESEVYEVQAIVDDEVQAIVDERQRRCKVEQGRTIQNTI